MANRPLYTPGAHLLIVSFILAISFNGLVAFAQEAETVPEVKVETSIPVTVPAAPQFPQEKILDITAYYSPLPNQEKYVTGSYESDIRLNGRGTNGADGTPVYPGMVAAPKTYAFGTKLMIPGVGTVAVHDRGGAIVSSAQNGRHDRLDIWMGFGDKGLRRALGWGRRTVKVTIYGVDASIREDIQLSNYDESERIASSVSRPPSQKNVVPVVVKPPMFPEDVWYMSSGESVVKVQQALSFLDYYKSAIDGFYGDETKEAVYAFQKAQNLFDSGLELGAGHTGPATRVALEKAVHERRKARLPVRQAGRGERGEDVLKLQHILRSLGYDVGITGTFDEQTEAALLQFQKEQRVVKTDNERGAGYFGLRTKAALETKYMASIGDSRAVVIVDVPSYLVQDLALNSTGIAVRQLQQELMKLNYLRIDPTGFYGPATAHAVFKFKQSQGLATVESDSGATTFESSTRERMNAIIASRFHTIKTIALKNGRSTAPMIANATAPSESLDTELLKVQKFLQAKGFLQTQHVTGTMTDESRKALITFQKANRIIASESEMGAGTIGPKTRAFINAFSQAS